MGLSGSGSLIALAISVSTLFCALLNDLRDLSCRYCTSLTHIHQLDHLEFIGCNGCTNLHHKNIGYLPNIKHQKRFKEQNEYHHKLRLIKPDINRKLGVYGGFTDDVIRMLEKY